MADNFLYYGDNLNVLRRHIKEESVDLIYLDPPFNSDQNYNVLFAEHNGSRSSPRIIARMQRRLGVIRRRSRRTNSYH